MVFSPLFLVSVVASVLYFIMIAYFLVGWLRLKQTTDTGQPSTDSTTPFVSVVIPTRNESKNIQACLQSIFKQSYPKDFFEVIVVDDYSTDPTLRLAREVNEKNLIVLDLMKYLGNPGEYFPNKKKAIALGIKNAKGELILATDGDCIVGEEWMATMVNAFRQTNAKLLTGPVFMKPALFPIEIFQQVDVMCLVGITGATIRNNFPTMCNGANLMYAKQTFLEIEGFKGNHDVPTGDDIFLMQKINERFPGTVGFVKSYKACVFTKPERSFWGFVSQRVRWISKSSRFSSWWVAAVLYFAYFFNLLIIVSGLFALQMQEFTWLPLAVLGGAKLFSDFVFNIPVTFFFRKWYMLLLLPFIEVFYVPYVVVIGVLSLTGKYRWKDRLVK